MQNLLTDYPEMMTPAMLSQYLDINYVKALELVKSGAFPVLKIGNVFKIPKGAFHDWLLLPGLKEVL